VAPGQLFNIGISESSIGGKKKNIPKPVEFGAFQIDSPEAVHFINCQELPKQFLLSAN